MIVLPRLSIDVPPQLLAELGWDPAAPLHLSVEGGALVVRPVTAQRPAPPPPPPSTQEVIGARMAVGVTRSDLAWLLGVSPQEVTAWEEGGAAPDDAARGRLAALAADPEAARARLDQRD